MDEVIQITGEVIGLPIESLFALVSLAGLGVAALAIVAVLMIARDKKEKT